MGHPGNPGILSILGLKGSIVAWDTKGHPGILSVLGFRISGLLSDKFFQIAICLQAILRISGKTCGSTGH